MKKAFPNVVRHLCVPSFSNSDRNKITSQSAIGKGANKGDPVILATIYFLLITVGTVWVIIWGMSAAGPHPKYKAKKSDSPGLVERAEFISIGLGTVPAA